jgi:MFS superfamily sulfate permease-like transporter
VLVFRPDGSLLYVNADNVLGTVLARLASEPPGSVRLVVCDLSAAPHLDLAAVGMLRKLHATLEGQRIRLAVAGPHGEVRDLLRREGFADLVGGVARITTLESILTEVAACCAGPKVGCGASARARATGSILAWPAISPPSSPTSAGVVQPHSLMLAAIAAT